MRKDIDDQQFLLSLGQYLRSLRVTKGVSQEVLSFQCGLHRTYIGAVERGERNITVLNLRRIAFALDLPISEVLLFEAERE